MLRFLPQLLLISKFNGLNKSPDNAARVSMSRDAFFSSRSEKKINKLTSVFMLLSSYC